MFFYKLWRLIKVLAHFAYGIVELTIKRPHSRPERAQWLCTFCRRVLRSVAITPRGEGNVPMSGAVITNHLTYLDILVHGAIRPCVFVSMIEVRRMPVIGWLSMMAGTIYVERGAGGSAEAAAVTMAKGFRDGLPVTFFPEGGTSDGSQGVLPFRSGLLAQSMAAGEPVTPGFIHYELDPHDIADGRTLEKDLHWGTQPMVGHMWNLLGLRPFTGTVTFAPGPIAFSEAAKTDRKVAAVEAHDAVVAIAAEVAGQ